MNYRADDTFEFSSFDDAGASTSVPSRHSFSGAAVSRQIGALAKRARDDEHLAPEARQRLSSERVAEIAKDVITDLPARDRALFHPTINLQEWEGRVTEISEDVFTASLADITAGERHETEEAEFLVSDLSDDDKLLLRPGAIFRWVIGYRKTGGTKERFSRVVFRRMPAWSRREIDAIIAAAPERANAITWD